MNTIDRLPAIDTSKRDEYKTNPLPLLLSVTKEYCYHMVKSNRMSRINLVGTSNCTGCAACVSICPVNSITLSEDDEGFLQPKIDRNTCINCHKCEKTCPIINKETTRKNVETSAYAAINKNESIRAKSSSGGVFYSLAKWTIERGGVVFGARFDDNWDVMHDYSEAIEGIIPFMGSKYVQSRIGDTYKQAKSFLEQGRWVLFSGTPCQLGGLRAFLGKEYEQLIQVDLICHGVPSPSVWRSYLKDFVTDGEILSVSFRDKKDGWLRFQNITTTTTTTTIREHQKENPYFRGFLKNVYLRKSCYNCQFRTFHRLTDITLADYWGVNELCPEMFDDKGTSVVFAHTEKGNSILLELNNEVELLPQTRENATKRNPSMDRENPKDSKRRRFFRLFRLTSFKNAQYVIDKDSFDKRVLRKIKKMVLNLIDF